MEFKDMAKKIILYVILIILGVSLTSCQTIQGMGSDIQWTAKKSAEAYGGEKTKAGNEEPQTWEGKKVKPEVEEDRY
jgi:predicted small secreted protein